MIVVPEKLARLATRQGGVVTRAQLKAADIHGRELSRWTERRMLTAFGTHVFRFVGAPVTYEVRLRGALLDCGPGSALSHWTAAAWLGIGPKRPPHELIHVAIARGPRIERPGVLVHTVRSLIPADVAVVSGLRTVLEARTLIDLAPKCSREELKAMVDASLARRRSVGRQVHERIEALRGRGRGGVAKLVEVIEDRPDGGLASVLERAFYELVKVAGLPRPETQVVYRLGGTHVARVDARFPDGLIVELQSRRWHTSPAAVERDSIRQRGLRLVGGDSIAFWAHEVFNSPDSVIKELRQHLALDRARTTATS